MEPLLLTDSSLPLDSPLVGLDEQVIAQVGYDNLKRALDDLAFQYVYPLCSHVSLDERKQLKVCCNAAGLQTAHPGVGRCYAHDRQLIRPRSPYAQYLAGHSDLQSVFETFQNRERKLNDLSDELSIARSMLALQVRQFETGKSGRNDEAFRNTILSLEMIRKIVDTIAKVQLTESSGITLPAITAFLWQVADILQQELVDSGTRIRILDRIATETSLG